MSGSELSLTHPWMKEHEQLAPKAWSFYSFDVAPEDYQVVVNVAAELDASCESLADALTRCSRIAITDSAVCWVGTLQA